jgi:hypothetical protein
MIGKDTKYVKILEKIRPLISGYKIQLPQIVVIEDQQIERIFCQVEAVIYVEYKNIMDSLNKK